MLINRYEVKLKFNHKIISIFQSVLMNSLSKLQKDIIHFETTQIASTIGNTNQHILQLQVTYNENLDTSFDINNFTSYCEIFEDAISELPEAIQSIFDVDKQHPERIVVSLHSSIIDKSITINSPLCLKLIEKFRFISDKNIFPTTILLPNSKQVTFNINLIAKRSEAQSSSLVALTGKIVGFSDKDNRFQLLSNKSKVYIIYIPSVENKMRTLFISHLQNKSNISILAYPTIEYIAGEEKEKAFQFHKINESQSDLDL